MPLQEVKQKQNNTRNVTELIQKLASVYEGPFGVELYQDIEPKINLNDLTSKMALFYEKLRYSVDYKDDHLLRRSAIERIAKRIMITNKEPKYIAETLLTELIRAQYIPNNSIPEEKADDLQKIISKYLTVRDQLEKNHKKENIKKFNHFLWEIMAAEIEENIIPPIREDALVETLYQIVKPRLDVRNFHTSKKEMNLQIYIALHRNIIKSDDTLLHYYLFKFYFPDWETDPNNVIDKVIKNFSAIVKSINHQIRHPLGELLQKKLHNLSVYFLILNDILAENHEQLRPVLSYEDQLEQEIKKATTKRYVAAKKKLRRGAVRSIIYIFFTKVIVALALEVPYDLWIVKDIHYVSIATNILFPPLLMALIILTTKVPKEENTKRIIEQLKNMVYGEELKPLVTKFKRSAQFGSTAWTFINTFYLIIYVVTFGVIVSVLHTFHFNIVSSTLFLLFLTLISFFGIRLRMGARELNVLGKKENIITFLFDLFTLPIIRVGRFISMNSKRINLFIFILDYVIESPYKFIVSGFEEITSFVKEKKDQVD